jgi:hypothetical protein
LKVVSVDFQKSFAFLQTERPDRSDRRATARCASFGHRAQHDSDNWQDDNGGKQPPKGTVETLLPFFEGAELPLAPFSLHEQPHK